MRAIVCGGRDYADKAAVDTALSAIPLTYIIEGGANGADSLARDYAISNGIAFRTFYANWKLHGRAAGPIRNALMISEGKPDLIIAFWNGKSPGTRNMITQGRKADIKVIIHYY